MIGRFLAHYEILEPLGSGGMGQVYRARDSKLSRQVALKVLPPKMASDPERRQRFEREARAVAALDHPNIVTVYSIEQALAEDGEVIDFITMQLVEGRTLSELIPRQGLPLGQFFDMAIPLSDALAAAHAHGIIHRDLKPSNIMVSDDGRPRILDFGLAKLRQEDLAKSLLQARPWREGEPITELTEEGKILGTADYMSPEQVEGKDVDHRSDIFSLGIIFHEMATGERPFQGDSKISVIASIVKDTPVSVTDLKPELPRHLSRILRHSLEKDPEQRFQSAQDLRNELSELREEIDSGELLSDALARRRSRRRKLTWFLSAGAAVVLLAFVWFYFSGAQQPGPPVRAVPLTSLEGSELNPAVSPDGNQVAFVWDGNPEGSFDLYVQLIGAGEALRLTRDPRDDRSPAWSPDGRQVAFLRRTANMGFQVMAVPALGGPERTLGSTPNVGFPGLDWSPDGSMLSVVNRSAPHEGESIHLLNIATGQLARLSQPPSESVGDKLPVFSPDGKSLAFVRWFEAQRNEIYTVSVDGRQLKRLTDHPGYVRGLDWLPDGSGLVVASKSAGSTGLWQLSTEGEITRLPFGEEAWGVSVAGNQRLVYSRELSHSNLWRVAGPAAQQESPPHRLIASTRDDWGPQYSPDGTRIAFTSDRTGAPQTWICSSEGQDCSQLVTEDTAVAPRWSPDGQKLVFGTEIEGHADIQILDLVDGLRPRRLTSDPSMEAPSGWSADGRWIYFFSDRSGEYQAWKISPEGGQPIQMTQNGGLLPQESEGDGHIYYMKLAHPWSIWRMPKEGGEEDLVLQKPGLGRSGFTLWREYLIYALSTAEGPVIESYNLTTSEVERRVNLGPATRLGKYERLTASPDGRWIAYPQVEGLGADLILVENFH